MPLYVVLERKRPRADGKIKKDYINLNLYRNWHFQKSNQIKKRYKEIAYPQIKDLRFNAIKLSFALYRANNRLVDRANLLSIHEKFFCDALVECGCIEDDNDDIIVSTYYYTAGIDKENPRVEIFIDDRGY